MQTTHCLETIYEKPTDFSGTLHESAGTSNPKPRITRMQGHGMDHRGPQGMDIGRRRPELYEGPTTRGPSH